MRGVSETEACGSALGKRLAGFLTYGGLLVRAGGEWDTAASYLRGLGRADKAVASSKQIANVF